MQLSPNATEARHCHEAFSPCLLDCAAHYNATKYPADIYEALLVAFGQPATVVAEDIERALVWKYGHHGKPNFPAHHRAMARRIHEAWPAFLAASPREGRDVFEHWATALRRRTTQPFITVTFLMHLLAPTQWPIMDQHTFRSMNTLMAAARPSWRTKLRPRSYDDLVLYAVYFDALIAAWPHEERPDRGVLDRALMVYGQDLKRGQRRVPVAESAHSTRA